MGLRIAVFLAALAAMPLHAAQCTAESGSGTAALVELYTSGGCSSCPPAERWLSTLSPRAAAGHLVPLALHVDYGDYIGWKDSPRQRKLTQRQKMALVYTPQVLLHGGDFRQWGGQAFDQAVARINAQPARAHLRLTILGADKTSLDVEARASLAPSVAEAALEAGLYIAAYGRTLRHDYVVLEWEGPFGVPRELSQRRRLPLLPGADRADSGVAAFVQDRRTGEVLQALLRSAC
jgi:hypothetical protein